MAERSSPAADDTGEYAGVLFIGDFHIAASPPGFRLDDYARTVLEKLSFCLETAARRRCLPFFWATFFMCPRDNPNFILVALIELLREHVPWVVVGNHDKYEARLTRDVSLAVLDAAGAVRLIDRDGPVASVECCRPKGPDRGLTRLDPHSEDGRPGWS